MQQLALILPAILIFMMFFDAFCLGALSCQGFISINDTNKITWACRAVPLFLLN